MTMQRKAIRALRNAPQLAMQFNHAQVLWFPTGSKNDDADQGGQVVFNTPKLCVFQEGGNDVSVVFNGRAAYIHRIQLSDNGGISNPPGCAMVAIEPYYGGANTNDPSSSSDGSYIGVAHTIGRGISMELGFPMDQGFRLNLNPTYIFTNAYGAAGQVRGTIFYSLEGGEGGI